MDSYRTLFILKPITSNRLFSVAVESPLCRLINLRRRKSLQDITRQIWIFDDPFKATAHVITVDFYLLSSPSIRGV